jgi:uroporphyrinogen decarboxylase
MTLKERVVEQIHRRETQPVPFSYHFSFVDPHAAELEKQIDDYYGDTAWKNRLDRCSHIATTRLIGSKREELSENSTRDVFGTVWDGSGYAPKIAEPALKEASLAAYRFPSADEFFVKEMREYLPVNDGSEPRRFTVFRAGFGLFERTWKLLGFTEALMDAAAEPVFYEGLVSGIADLVLKVLERHPCPEADAVMFADDWGDQHGVTIGPERWRRFFKPYYAKIYDYVHKQGKYVITHCCGNVVDIMPDLIEIGLDMLQSVQPEAMDPYMLKKNFGRDICFWGGLGSQSTLPFSDPAEVRTEIQRLCREMGKGGGYILGTAKQLQADTPLENAIAAIEEIVKGRI